MSRQLDLELEKRETTRRNQLIRALEFGIVGALEAQGIELVGFAVKYDAFNCLLTLRAEIGGDRQVAFVGSDSLVNCFLKTESDALRGCLSWRADRYHPKQV